VHYSNISANPLSRRSFPTSGNPPGGDPHVIRNWKTLLVGEDSTRPWIPSISVRQFEDRGLEELLMGANGCPGG